MFKVCIPTIHLLWTCLNTHYLYLKSSHPSQSSAPVAVPHQLQKSATSHHQRSCRGDHLLLWKKIHHHLRSIYPRVTYRFRGQKYRTSVVMRGLLFWRCFISFPQEISVMIFFFQMAIIQGMRWRDGHGRWKLFPPIPGTHGCIVHMHIMRKASQELARAHLKVTTANDIIIVKTLLPTKSTVPPFGVNN